MDRLVVVGRKAREQVGEAGVADANEPDALRATAVFSSEESRRDDRGPKNQEISEGNAATISHERKRKRENER